MGEVQCWEFSGKCGWSYCHGLQLRNKPENYQVAKCHEYRCKGLSSESCIIYRGGKLTQLSVCVSTLIHTLSAFRQVLDTCSQRQRNSARDGYGGLMTQL